MKLVGEMDGKRVYWAEPGSFKHPGVYYWDGQQNIHVPLTVSRSEVLLWVADQLDNLADHMHVGSGDLAEYAETIRRVVSPSA